MRRDKHQPLTSRSVTIQELRAIEDKEIREELDRAIKIGLGTYRQWFGAMARPSESDLLVLAQMAHNSLMNRRGQ